MKLEIQSALPMTGEPGCFVQRLVGPRYWLTPPDLYERLNSEFHFDFDPCPCPLPIGYDGTAVAWGKRNYVNPPFRSKDGGDGKGPTAFAHKAIAEARRGNTSVLLLPVQSYVALLVAAGAEVRSLGRVRWIEADTGEPMPNPSQICAFILRPNDKLSGGENH